MNREQIVKALECCASGTSATACDGCPLRYEEGTCDDDSNYLLKQALSLIREMEIELEAMRTAANSLKMHYEKLAEENDRVRADTVRKMVERLTSYYNILNGSTSAVLTAYHIEQVAKELLDGAEPFGIMDGIKKRMEQDTCVSCGNIIPEGRQVCLICEEEVREND